METFNKTDFLELFNSIKKGGHKVLTNKAENDFKRLKKLEFTKEDFEKAITQMFTGDISYLLERGLNTPSHLLINSNFERYLARFENAEKLKEIKKAELLEKKEAKEDPKIIDKKVEVIKLTEAERLQNLENSKNIYSESLKCGFWLGNISNAMEIGKLFTDSFTVKEKIQFKIDGIEISRKQKEIRSNSIESVMSVADRMLRKYWEYAMFELVIKEAIKRKIKEPWL